MALDSSHPLKSDISRSMNTENDHSQDDGLLSVFLSLRPKVQLTLGGPDALDARGGPDPLSGL